MLIIIKNNKLKKKKKKKKKKNKKKKKKKKKKRYLCFDEADRMIDMGFEEDVRNIMSFFKVINII